MIPVGFPIGTLSGKFLSSSGAPIEDFALKLDATREAITQPGIFYDLGPIFFVLNEAGELINKTRPEDGLNVVADGFSDQPFNYRAKISGCGLEYVTFLLEVKPGEIVDVPQALVEEIPVEDIPEWLAVLQQVKALRDEVVDIVNGINLDDTIKESIEQYLEDNPLEGATTAYVDGKISDHIQSESPHPTYDGIPNLTLLFENKLV